MTDFTANPEFPVIENIEILGLLGNGCMSLVYKAKQILQDKIVAVKVLSSSAFSGESEFKRFQTEAKLTSSLDHPNIVKTYAYGIAKDGRPYFVMEYIEGLSLSEEFKRNGRLSLEKFRDVFLPALSALSYAHSSGLIHRDIKPENIMICRNDSTTETVKLVDFGIAKLLSDNHSGQQYLTKTGTISGTPAYMSPEQCAGEPLDGRSDLYSIACVMYEALSGEPPFSGETTLVVMQKHRTEPAPTVSELSRKIDVRKELAAVTVWALAKDVAMRPQSANDFAIRLSKVLEQITLNKVPKLRDQASNFRQSLLVVGLSLLTLCVVLGAAIHTSQKRLNAKKEINDLVKNSKGSLGVSSVASNSTPPEDISELYRLVTSEQFALAEPGLKRLISQRAKASGENSLSVAEAYDLLATCNASENGKLSEAITLANRALAIKKKKLEPDDPQVASSLMLIGTIYAKQGDFPKAEQLIKEAAKKFLAACGPDDLKTADAYFHLAECYKDQRKYDKSEEYFSKAIPILEKSPQDEPRRRLLIPYRSILEKVRRLKLQKPTN